MNENISITVGGPYECETDVSKLDQDVNRLTYAKVKQSCEVQWEETVAEKTDALEE